MILHDFIFNTEFFISLIQYNYESNFGILFYHNILAKVFIRQFNLISEHVSLISV